MSKDNFDDFDDVLDDDFDEKTTNNMSTQQVDNLVNSFSKPDNPEDPDEPVDEKTMNQLLNQVQNMPKAKLQQYLKQLTGKNNFNLGNNIIPDIRSSGIRDKLRKKLAEQKKTVKTKSAKKYEVCISNNNKLRDIDDIMNDIEGTSKPKKKNKKRKKKKQ